jgi:hypothetical protein
LHDVAIPAGCRRRARGGSAAEIDVTTPAQLRAVLLERAGAGHPTAVVDMTRTCPLIHGLPTLLRAQKRALSAGGELRLVVPADGTVSVS